MAKEKNQDEVRIQGIRDCLAAMVDMGNQVDSFMSEVPHLTQFMEKKAMLKLAEREESPEHVLHIKEGFFRTKYECNGKLYEITFRRPNQ